MMKEEDEPPNYYTITDSELIPPRPSAPFDEATSISAVPVDKRTLSASFPPLTALEVKDACYRYVAAKYCYGTSFIENMIITSITDRTAYQYTLESFGEQRQTLTHIRKYDGIFVASAEIGVPPLPWDVPVTPLNLFKDHYKNVEIPHTAYLIVCSGCEGKGDTMCMWCLGVGGKGCLLCMFDESRRPCSSCRFTNRSCFFCNGLGRKLCEKCGSKGKLRACRMLKVTWTNHVEHFVSDTMRLPMENILEAKGKVLFTEEKDELLPICNAADVPVNIASTDLITKHRRCFTNELIIKQKHTLRALPYSQVKYHWKDYTGEFYVYGLEKATYFDEYPQRCCCNVM